MSHIEYDPEYMPPSGKLDRHNRNAAELQPIIHWNRNRVARGLRRYLAGLPSDSSEAMLVQRRLDAIDGDDLP